MSQTRRVFDLNYVEYRAYREQWPDAHIRAQQGRNWLRQAVYQQRRTAAFHARWLPVERDQEVVVQHGFWWSEPDVLNNGCLLRPAGREYDILLLALFERCTLDLDDRREALFDCMRAGFAVLALDVRGTGAVQFRATKAGRGGGYGDTAYKPFTDLLWLDDSLVAMQVYDVLRAVELVSTDREIALGPRPIHLHGHGPGAYLAYLAAVLEPRLTAIELVGPLPDLEQILTERLYAPPSSVPGTLPMVTLPGLARHCTLEDLELLIEGRVVRH